ncbi:MAG: ribosome-associated translation inhibitor RaiA [Nitrospinae bacterium]|nr:ribosome-associated translation inhibitor RaiA [Nitrospinota bacterium]
MQITVTGRNIEMTDALKKYAEEKVQRVKKYIHTTIDAHVILAVEKFRQKAEVTINVNGFKIYGEEETEDMYSSIDKVMDKIERQVRKHKERIWAVKSKQHEKDVNIRMNVIARESIEEPSDTPHRIIKTRNFAYKPMPTEEAAMQMDLLGYEFLIFRNSMNDKINVIYKRKDGNYGLIEPE